MLVLLPFFALFFLVLIVRAHKPLWRQAILTAAVVWGVLVTAVTEVLSLFHALTATWVATLWTLVILGLVPFLLNVARCTLHVARREGQSPLSIFMLVGVGLIMATTAMIGLVAPPTTWDSMTYHMSRVMHWIQNQSVAHYPTHTLVQLHRPPWAEFAVLNLQLLSQSDRFASLVQWGSMIGSVLGVTLIAKQLGGGLQSQIFAAVVASTLPMGILEASSTQTDYAGAFWLVCFVSCLLSLLEEGKEVRGLFRLWQCGAALGLAILTRPSAYLYALPFLVWMVFARARMGGLRWVAEMLVIAAMTAALNLGHYSRNFELYRSPLGPTGNELCADCNLTNEAWTISLLFSTIIRNVALHLGTPLEPLNFELEGGVYRLHTLFGLSTNDPRTTLLHQTFMIAPPVYDENIDGNPLHLLLIIATLIMLFRPGQAGMPGAVRLYAGAVIAGFVLLCFLVKWNHYNSRLHLPLFVLWSPVIALALSRIRSSRLVHGIIVGLFAWALPSLLFNSYRPLIVKQHHYERLPLYSGPIDKPDIFHGTRSRLYFSNWPEVGNAFQEAVDGLKRRRCFQVGLVKGWDDWEYPLWPLLQAGTSESITPEIRIEHISVSNQSSILASHEPFRTFTPCAVLKIDGQSVTTRFIDEEK